MIFTWHQILTPFWIIAIFEAFSKIMKGKLLGTLQVPFGSLAFIFQQVLM